VKLLNPKLFTMKNLFIQMFILLAILLPAAMNKTTGKTCSTGKTLQVGLQMKTQAVFWWKMDSWYVTEHRSHLFYETDRPYKNFELIAEVKTLPLANSGIYFHTAFQESGWPGKGYEVQINNSYQGPAITGKQERPAASMQSGMSITKWSMTTNGLPSG
jgi:hypothetical protein